MYLSFFGVYRTKENPKMKSSKIRGFEVIPRTKNRKLQTIPNPGDTNPKSKNKLKSGRTFFFQKVPKSL